MTNIYDIISKEEMIAVYCVITGRMEPIKLLPLSEGRFVIITIEDCFSFDKHGRASESEESECLLFPSKYERNWDRFAPKSKYNLGDIRRDQYGDMWINQGNVNYHGELIANFTITPAHEDVVHKKQQQ